MLRKLILLVIFVVFLTGCGASAPAADPANGTEIFHRADLETSAAVCGEALRETVEHVEYFTFTSRTNSVTNSDGVTILYENQTIPSFHSNDRELSAWVNEILDSIGRNFQADSANLHRYAEEFIQMNGVDAFYSHSNYQQLGVTRHDDAVVSLICLNSLYSGGTHPNAVQTASNLDVQNKRILKLEDVIEEGREGVFAQMVRSSIEALLAPLEYGLYEDYGQTIETSMVWGNMTPYWYFNSEGMVVFYNQYELGPYAAGIIKAELGYSDLTGILREEYFPAQPDGTTGDLKLCHEAESAPITIRLEPEGETLLVAVQGTVHQVRLSEVLWLEDKPITQNVLFSAKTLESGDTLALVGVHTDGSHSYAIEFLNGTGTQQIRYLSENGLTEKP